MIRRLALTVFALFVMMVPATAEKYESSVLFLESPAFDNMGNIPVLYTCAGEDISPPLTWSGVPEGTKSFVLIMDDPDAPDPEAPKKVWVHWVLINIPANVTELPARMGKPAGAIEGVNDWKETGYRGPCPPIGKHRYVFKLYALNAAFGAKTNPTKQEIERAMSNHLIASATLIGLYGHAKR